MAETMTADALFHALVQERAGQRCFGAGVPVEPEGSEAPLADDAARLVLHPSQAPAWVTGLPAAVGIALAERHSGRGRPVVAIIGDGSFQYASQALWTAAQLELPIVFVVPRNGEYAILKSFAELEDTPGVPGLDLPGIDIAMIARGYGCEAENVSSPAEAREAFRKALGRPGPTVIVAMIDPSVPDLL